MAGGRHAGKRRCSWAGSADPDYVRYHDEEWGRPVHDDRLLFEMLTLEGAQAGLSWSTILRKRAGYRRAFANFEPRRVARFDARRRAALRRDAGIVRNRLKIESTVTNARAFLALQREFGSFDRYLWSFVAGKPIVKSPAQRRGTGAHAAERPGFPGPRKTRLSLRGYDHRVCVPAGGRSRERSRPGLLSVSAAARTRGRAPRALQATVALGGRRLLR